MKALSLQEKEDSWNWLRQQFMEKSDAYEEKKESCGKQLEHAFDFMEAAFANGQELVIFVTGLNTGEAGVEFLKEYNCERYYRYNSRAPGLMTRRAEWKKCLKNDDERENSRESKNCRDSFYRG